MFDRDTMMVGVFSLTVFVSASLLFVVQPMAGKLILPYLGGSSSVWTTCMLFFQIMLVAGYVYAHVLAKYVAPKHQAWVHLAIMGVACAASLPLHIPKWLLDTQSQPAAWLLIALLAGIGLPLFIVSTSAPLLQRWFSYTDHPDRADPYYLYAASNVGSMVALLGYPFVVEPMVGLDSQRWIWSAVFLGLTGLAALCGWYLWQYKRDADFLHREAEGHDEIEWLRRARWVGLAFIPSSLMLGVTDYMTTDLASVPLLWVLPLAIYLGTFILVFARDPFYLPDWSRTLLPVAVLILLGVSVSELWMSILIALHLLTFFFVAMFFHGELAKDRPHTSGLTDFFIWMSVGGALGGVFNAIIAPKIFDLSLEYTLVLSLAVAAIVPNTGRIDNEFNPTGAVPAVFALVGMYYLWMLGFWSLDHLAYLGLALLITGGAFALGTLVPRAENLAVSVVLLSGLYTFLTLEGAIDYERSFYASYAVYQDEHAQGSYRKLSHGTTAHGVQALEEGMEQTAFGYHHPEGPVGQVMRAVPSEKVLVMGLGAGAMAAYGGSDRHMTFYEIDPIIEKVARKYFSYLEHCGLRCSVKIGDGRKLLEREETDTYDVIFMDAYNSDSVPTHLLTKEAVELYLQKLEDDGVLVFHVSNRYLNIEGIVGSLADELDLVTRTQIHVPSPALRNKLVWTSAYTVVARDPGDLRSLYEDDRWRETDRAGVVWTDNYSNIPSVFDWQY